MCTIDLSLLLLLTVLINTSIFALELDRIDVLLIVSYYALRQAWCNFFAGFASRLLIWSRASCRLCDICLGMEDIHAVKVSLRMSRILALNELGGFRLSDTVRELI